MDTLTSLRDLLQLKKDIPSEHAGNERNYAKLSDTLGALNKLLPLLPQASKAEPPANELDDRQEAAQLILRNLDTLATENIVGDNPPELYILTQAQTALSLFMRKKLPEDFPKFTLVAPPSFLQLQTLEHGLTSTLSSMSFLHLLAVHPDRALSPGKSLRSVLASPQAIRALGGDPESMGIPEEQSDGSNKRRSAQEAITSIAHKAFWDEALEALSSPLPSIQLSRLRRIYQDLYTALTSNQHLLPPSHILLATLSSPPSPTSAPLNSAVRHLRELVSALRERCAPVRDAVLDQILTSLIELSSQPQFQSIAPAHPQEVVASSRERMSRGIINATRSTLDVIAQMQTDLKAFMLSSIPDSDLRATLRQTAREGEQEIVLKLYGDREALTTKWNEWTAIEEERGGEKKWAWIRRLVGSFSADVPVACQEPSSAEDRNEISGSTGYTEDHLLPPPFLFSIHDLVRVQNYIQALVIAAALRTLLPTPNNLSNLTSETAESENSFTERILTLLAQDIENVDKNVDGDSDSTKLAHLADEVIRERARRTNIGLQSTQQASFHPETYVPHTPERENEADRMRIAVSGLLRSDASAFKLLRNRLLSVLPGAIISSLHPSRHPHAPEVLRAGTTGERVDKRPRLGPLPSHRSVSYTLDEGRDVDEKILVGEVRVKGYEGDGALQNALRELVRSLVLEVIWIRDVWGGILNL